MGGTIDNNIMEQYNINLTEISTVEMTSIYGGTKAYNLGRSIGQSLGDAWDFVCGLCNGLCGFDSVY